MPNESTTTQYYHKKLKALDVYCLKLNLIHSSGVVDSWFSGDESDVWVEFKYLKALPKRFKTEVPVNLSALQIKWINERSKEGRRILIIICTPEGDLVIYPWQLADELTMEDFKIRMTPRIEVIKWIAETINA